MSNDLISRSAVIAIIENKRLSTGKRDLPTEYALADVQEKIEKLKTAYDADKVLEKLRKEIGDCQYECEKCKQSIDCDTCRAEKAVEIAKAGGVNENR